ncbi:hypothetical protein C4579_02930 [Candidatus Microgenomates bacterium]|nr:MAG: hypothetical protein C4579_02930 [Candidatus Microgenomates bacterium]
MLTKQDLEAIEQIIDKKLDEKLDLKLKPVFERLDGIDDFISFAKPALISLLEESEERHKLKLPERVSRLEEVVKSN